MPPPQSPYTLSHTPGTFKRFSKKVWTFQRTFETPLSSLEPFVSAIVSGLAPTTKGTIVIDGYVFEPKNLWKFLSALPQSRNLTHDWSIEATNRESAKKLLIATFQDWIDFVFVPTPQPFTFYADHDEYTTFYAMTKSNLNRAVQPLLTQGFVEVKGFKRSL
jgi:hypothetical protein